MDYINGSFELLGAFFILPSILKLHREKQVRGVSFVHVAFFLVWAAWNIAYYPALGQWCSLAGGFGVLLANTVWAAQLFYYRKR